MSWLLKNKKIIIVGLLCSAIILSFTKLWVLSLLIILAIGLFALNKIVLRKSNKMPLFSARREIKKYKYLVIGDLCPSSVLKKYIKQQDDALMILAPRRSLDASYQILLHTISILDENGMCIIIGPRRCPKRVYTVFDVPYLNFITRKELHIEWLAMRASFPILYEPIKTFSILFNISLGHIKYKNVTCQDNRFTDFFRKRTNQFVYIKSY